MNPLLHRIARRLHRYAPLRRFAKRAARGRTVTQSFHGGVICLDAVEHAWAWTGTRTLDQFERPVQDRLYELSRDRALFIDVGCNVGVMAASVLLRNPRVSVVAFEPNPRAAALFRQTVRRNQLESRVTIRTQAISAGEPSVGFEPEGSFTGHVHPSAPPVAAVALTDVVAEYRAVPILIKIDIEGYETRLSASLAQLAPAPGSILVIELHPLGFNGMGDPEAVVTALRGRRDVTLSRLGGDQLGRLDPQQFHQLEVRWP